MYLDRIAVKQYAKQRIAAWMGSAILVSFLCLLLCGSGGSDWNLTYNVGNNLSSRWLLALIPLAIALLLFHFLYTVFVGNVILVGQKGWSLRFWRGEYPSVGEMFAGFRMYTPAMLTTLLRDLFVFLWTLLLVVPGIVMGYAYSMSEYIIYENPRLSPTRALEMSKVMTSGYKGDLFLFDLSFLGWQILSLFTLGILGIVYVNPYYDTAHAGMYDMLKTNALQRGLLRPEDFGMIPCGGPQTGIPPYPPAG